VTRETLPVLYLDERMVVVDKPSGLLVHRSPIDRHETRFALQIVRDQLGRRVHPVHRLDKGTSGALVMALDAEAAAVLSQAFATRSITKTYVALVRGWPDASGTIDRPLTAVDDVRAGPQSCEPRDAHTTFRRLATYELPVRVDRYPSSRYALLELTPLTGRRHQLRRHLAGASHPIVGDSTYGKGRHNRLFAERYGVRRLLLACTRLEFASIPGRTGPLRVDAPLGGEFEALLTALAKAGVPN
jgi:tRNA pseudouridine65 synthase